MTESDDGRGGRGRLGGGAVAALLGLAILLIFIVQNTEVVEFRFLVLRFGWPLWLYTVATALVGGLIWFGLGVVRRHRRRRERRLDRC